MIRCRFKTTSEDPRPVNWPVPHPFWVSGEGEGYSIIVAYADDETEILKNWPEATHLDSEETTEYLFTSRFPMPEWFTPQPPAPRPETPTSPRVTAALRELVTLKAAKDSGFTGDITQAEYRRRKNQAWIEAQAALQQESEES